MSAKNFMGRQHENKKKDHYFRGVGSMSIFHEILMCEVNKRRFSSDFGNGGKLLGRKIATLLANCPGERSKNHSRSLLQPCKFPHYKKNFVCFFSKLKCSEMNSPIESRNF